MKRCPTCNRVETDETLKFCRADGATLVSESAPLSAEAGTAQFGSASASTEIETSILPHRTDAAINRPTAPTTVLPAQSPTSTNGKLAEPVSKRKVIAALVLVGIVAVVVSSYFVFFRKPTTAIDSIAVLPFQNDTNDPSVEYLSDGLAESLIDSLTQLQQLKVMARSTAFRYKGKEVDPQSIGRELNVRAVLMGRVRQFGDRLNIKVDLVDATTGAQLWGEDYERSVADIVSVKQAIAREVTEKLRLRLSGNEQQQLAKRDTANAESFQFYLRGRFYWNKRTAGDLKKAIQEFQQAIDRDPNYALAYVGMADCYLVMEQYAGTPVRETLPKAKAAVDRALQIDEASAEAHASLAAVNERLYRWPEAEAEFRRAISLNPNYATAHHWFALNHLSRRQFDDALSEMKRAQELDPLSPIIGSTLAMVHLLKNNVDSAREQCLRMIELEPKFPSAHLYLGWSYLKQGRNEEATAELEKAVEFSGRASFYLADLGYLHAITGRRNEALAILKELENKNSKGESSFESLAAVHAGLGDKDQMFVLLEKGLEAREDLTSVIWWFDYDAVRGDPRYADLLRRMGVAQ
jgi:eukaryotic-like serine/threonine-protein kinase